MTGLCYDDSMLESYEIRIRKDALKFAASHMTGMKRIALAWDEKVLVATRNPFYEPLRLDDQELEFRLCGKRYVLPVDEVVRLDTDNISCETLARTYFDLLEAELGPELHADNILSVAVYIEETPGQGAAFERVMSP
jgi:6-pyruvoyltetrahydropterin/6-carboxytetrahydropterin synthase